ncbi:MAG: hypothetical protein IJC96_00465 [Clostridia bacterium]|nr:hypothetical protein [Clostridia bacterium]
MELILHDPVDRHTAQLKGLPSQQEAYDPGDAETKTNDTANKNDLAEDFSDF